MYNLFSVKNGITFFIIIIITQQTLQPLPRVITGNLEYRILLRCRHASKAKFMKLRSDVLVKLQLLDNKRGKLIRYIST